MKVFVITGFWRRKFSYYPLKESLEKSGHNVEIIDLREETSLFNDIPQHADYIFERFNETGDVVIITHSLSGIILKYLIKTRPSLTQNIRGILFVTVPHQGTWAALVLAIFPAIRQLLPITKFIRKTKNVSLPVKVVNFLAASEIKILPNRNSVLDKCSNITIPLTNHDNIIKNKQFIDKVVEFVNSIKI